MKKCKVNVKEMKKREFKFLESVESYIDWISVSGSHGGGSFLLGLPLLLILWLGAIWSLRVHNFSRSEKLTQNFTDEVQWKQLSQWKWAGA